MKMDEEYLQQDDREDTENARMEYEQWLNDEQCQEEYLQYLLKNKQEIESAMLRGEFGDA